MADSETNSAEVLSLADEFLARYRRGERPSLAEYIERYPHLADQIRDVFPAMAMMENIAIDESATVTLEENKSAGAERPFRQLGDFRILREVGRGGMGIVYEAEQLSLGRHVALKVLPQQLMLDAKHRRRFEREARAAARLHHTNIVPVFGVGENDGMHYYVMQFIQGLGLNQVLKELQDLRGQPAAAAAGRDSGPRSDLRGDVTAAGMARSLLRGEFERTARAATAGELEVGQDTPAASPGTAAATELLPAERHDETTWIGPGSNSSGAVARADTMTGRFADTSSLSGSVVLPGQSAAQSSTRVRKPTYWQSVAHIGIQVAGALKYAHDQGILHRDIKPSNLLLDLRGTVWITDFGLAKAEDQQDITHTGDILGTLRYMPPEAFEGKTDPRGDIYSLGLTLYELLALRPAFEDKDRNRLISLVTRAEAPRLEKLNPQIPRDLATVVHKAIERDAGHRYPTAQALAEDLQRFVDDEPIQARRVTAAEHVTRWARRNKWLATSLSVTALMLVLIVIGLTLAAADYRRREADQAKLARKNHDLATKNELLAGDNEATARKALAAKELAEQAQQRETVLLRHEQDARRETQEALETSRRNLYTASLSAAQRALEVSQDRARARELLDDARPQPGQKDLRGWEWYYLYALCARSEATAQTIPTHVIGRPFTVAFSPGSRWLAIGHDSGHVVVLDARSGAKQAVLECRGELIWNLAWSPDGRSLAAACHDRTIRVWETETWSLRRTLKGHDKPVRAVVFSPDGERVVSASEDFSIRIWDIRSGRTLRVLEGHTNQAIALDWSRDGTRLASGSDDGTLRIWDPETGQSMQTFTPHQGRPVAGVAFSPDGRRVATAGYTDLFGAVRVLDAQTGEELRAYRARRKGRTVPNPITGEDQISSIFLEFGGWCVAWRPDGRALAAYLVSRWGRKGTIRIWDDDSGRELFTREIEGVGVGQISWTADGTDLAASLSNRAVGVWNISGVDSPTDTRGAVRLAGHGTAINALAWNSHGDRLATAGADGTVKVWDAATRSETLTFRHGQSVSSVTWAPDGSRLASCSREGEIKIWDSQTGQVVKSLPHEVGGTATHLAWSPDGRTLASVTTHGDLRLITPDSDEQPRRLWFGRPNPQGVVWSAGGRYVGEWARQGQACVWNAETGDKPFDPITSGDVYTGLAFHPDGRIALGGATSAVGFTDRGHHTEGFAKILDSKGSELLTISGRRGAFTSLEWSADGERLLTAGTDGTLRIHDAGTGRELLSIDATGSVGSLLVRPSPDGTQIALAADDGSLLIYDAAAAYAGEITPRMLPALDRQIARQSTRENLLRRAQVYAAEGRWDEAAADFERSLTSPGGEKLPAWLESGWWVVGPYPPNLLTPAPPEAQSDVFQPVAGVSSDGQTPLLSWNPVRLGADHNLNLGRALRNAAPISGYATMRVYSPVDQPAVVLFGADDGLRLWLNGEVIYTRAAPQIARPDDEGVQVTLHRGWNTLLAKVSNFGGEHELILRFSDSLAELAAVYERDGRWEEALALWDRVVTANPADPTALRKRAAAALFSDRTAEADESFALLAALRPGDRDDLRWWAELHLRRGLALVDVGKRADAVANFEQARKIGEELLAADPADDRAAASLARALLELHGDSGWTTLVPNELIAQNGTMLTLQPDGSVLAGGINPANTTYTLRTTIGPQMIAALRLEVLPDRSFPARGPGRSFFGNFVLTEVRANLQPVGDSGPTRPIVFRNAGATHVRPLDNDTGPKDGPAAVIDGDPSSRWDIHPHYGSPNSLWLELSEPLEISGPAVLTVELDFNHPLWKYQGLGRFRLSLTAQPRTIWLDDRELNGFTALGAARMATGDFAGARQALARATQETIAQPEAFLLLALAENKLELSEPARHSYKRGLDQLKRRPGAAFVRSLARQAMIEVGASTPEAADQFLERVHEIQQVAQLTADVQRPSSDGTPLLRRGEWYACRGRWPAASADFNELFIRFPNNRFNGMRAAAALVLTGRADVYREHCRRMLAQFEDSQDLTAIESTCKACLLLEGAVDFPAKHLATVERRITAGTAPDWFVNWGAGTLALAAYRSGDFPRALDWCTKSVEDPNPMIRALGLPVKAMALHRLGRLDEARQTLDVAAALLPDLLKEPTFGSPNPKSPAPVEAVHFDWMLSAVLQSEAERLLAGHGWDWAQAAQAEGTQPLDRTSTDPQPFTDRGLWHLRRGEWKPAAAAFLEAIDRSSGDDTAWLRAAAALAHADDASQIRELCRRLEERSDSPSGLTQRQIVANLCLLCPGTIEVPKKALAALAKALESNTAPEGQVPWGFATLALAACRRGDHQEALSLCRKVLEGPMADQGIHGQLQAFVRSVEAIANHGLGESAAARRALEAAAELIPAELQQLTSHASAARVPVATDSVQSGWLTAEKLRLEAQALILSGGDAKIENRR